MASDREQAAAENTMPVIVSRYSKRVVLKTILGRSDCGLGLVGERVVVLGWVKSAKEVRKEPVPNPDAARDVGPPKDVSCLEVLQSRIPFFRTILKALGETRSIFERSWIRLFKSRQCPQLRLCKLVMVLVWQVFRFILGDSFALQIQVESSIAPPIQLMPTGTCILTEGILQQPLVQGKQVIELKAEKILHIGTVDQETYPLSKKRLPLETLRDSAHFRPRTTTVASVMRIRNALTQATHTFFKNQEFLYVEVPIITTTDSEGSSEKFHVTTLLSKEIKKEQPITMDDTKGVNLEAVKASIMEKNKQVEELKRTESNKEALAAAIQDLRETNELALQLEAREKSKPEDYLKTEKFRYSEDFFSRETYLTVNGRLHLESYACALGNVYSFGPRFQAERSESKKLVAEMWMIELEMALSQLEDAINCADYLLKFLFKWILENCSEDLTFLAKRVDKTIMERLQLVAESPFENISYAQAVDALKKVTEKTFGTKIEWGVSLTEEHESYLADEVYKRPVVIYNPPKELKPFYVRLNDDGKTVAAFDVVIPKVGALIRGSQNEERLNVLSTRIKELGLQKQHYDWYLDLRRHGTVKHSGFSLGFDLMILFATGLNDVRDVIPFPRSCGKANN
ncbi:hypothetical protein RJ639_018280 [Escallonia herrerae]|uniref:Aminoacyl-tRNA synthetase class II (D/K/N) domain-containing protein n=1 Tax=Escallonia herrerae TaxID=1293975 RepID=A0AA89AJQ8_9ASTE|nr:hypothetical protein RJ639_018280 [Escallonia herrerae]